MKVENVVIVNDFNYVQGGASKVAIDTARLLYDEGIKVYFFSAVNKREEEIKGINYVSTNQNEALKEKNRFKGFFNGIYNYRARKELKKLLIQLDPKVTVIHVHGWTKALSSSIFDVVFEMKFKMILTLHDYFTACPNGGYFDYQKNEICKRKPLSWECVKCNCDSRNFSFKIYRMIRHFVQNKIVKLNDKIKYAIGISDLNINVLKATLNNDINIKKIYNPVEIESIKNEHIDNQFYLYVGRVSKEKGVDLFCDAISELQFKGIVVGDGYERERLEKKYCNIDFVGWKNENEVKKYMKEAKALVFPSLWYEGAPLTPLEAMSFSIPCIINECCSAREYMGKEFLFHDLKTLKQKLLMIENNQINFEQYNKHCSNVLEKFKVKKYIYELKLFYNSVLNESYDIN